MYTTLTHCGEYDATFNSSTDFIEKIKNPVRHKVHITYLLLTQLSFKRFQA